MIRHGSGVKTMPEARREFARKHSPWIIGAAIAVALAARIAVGDFGWPDLIAIAAMLVVYPFGEWAIHVYILHMKPFELFGRRIEFGAAEDHKQHHGSPADLTMLLLEPAELAQLLLLSVPLTPAIASGIFYLVIGSVPIGALLTALITGYVLVGLYEWTHFLIHTSYRPRSRYYRAVWRNHRLHHFKNEHFWHGITNNFSDRVLGTNPDQKDVWKSKTARTLEPGATE